MTAVVCGECGHSYAPAAAPGGMCPRCLLSGGADDEPPEEPALDELSPEDLRDAVPGFRIEALLGRGGMGAVFRAHQLDLERDVAIKFIAVREDDPAFGERFEREARTMARLNHPNIVSVHSYGRTRGNLAWIVMEYVEGGDLAQIIAAGRVPESTALGLTEQVCSALAYAHAEGCVHRDIKPGNILVDKNGRVKVADFGLVKLVGEHAAVSALTLSFAGVGTPLYAAPEQVKPGLAVDHRADIYALGVMLYEMLTGEVPRGVFQTPSARSGTLRRWDGIVARAMDAQPERRFASTSDLVLELAVIRRQLAPGYVPWRKRWKRIALAAAGVAAVAGVVYPFVRTVDYTITITERKIVITGRRGTGAALTISENSPGYIRLSAKDRTFRTGVGFGSGDISDSIPAGWAGLIVIQAEGDTVIFDDDLSLVRDTSMEVSADSITVADSANIVASGSGSIALKATRAITIAKDASLEAVDGGITIEANQQEKHPDGSFVGVDVNGGLLKTTGSGGIAVRGRGGNGGGAQHGVSLSNAASLVATGPGMVSVNGTASSAAQGGQNFGVLLIHNASIIGGTAGTTTVTGRGGGGSSDHCFGISVHDALISSNGAHVQVTGTGGPASGKFHSGVQVQLEGTITSTGGNVSVTGFGGGIGPAGACMGVSIYRNGTITSGGRNSTVTVTGTGGNGSGGQNHGVGLAGDGVGGTITSGGGSLTIRGTSGAGSLRGISLQDRLASISTAKNGGDLTLIADSMFFAGPVTAGDSSTLTLRQITAGLPINLGKDDSASPPALGLTDDELENLQAGTVQIGDELSGEITVTGPIRSESRLKLARPAEKGN